MMNLVSKGIHPLINLIVNCCVNDEKTCGLATKPLINIISVLANLSNLDL